MPDNRVPGREAFGKNMREGFKQAERGMDVRRFTVPTWVYYDIAQIGGQAFPVPAKVTRQNPVRERAHGVPFVDNSPK